jgi:hypothetical protein
VIKAVLELDDNCYLWGAHAELIERMQQQVLEFLRMPEQTLIILAPGIRLKIFDIPEGADVPISVEIRPIEPTRIIEGKKS